MLMTDYAAKLLNSEGDFFSVIHKIVPEHKLRHDLKIILFWLYSNC